MTGLSIGALAKQADAKIQTIRYYEQIGMLPPVSRTTGGQRRYTGAHRDRLRFIRHARELGFSLDSIRDLLDLADRPDRDCAEADRIARSHLGTVRERIAALQALEAELSRMVAECAGGRVAECRVIEVLSDHTECRYHASTGRQVALGSTPNPTGTS